MAMRKRTDSVLPRWSVAYGGYPDGWDTPFCMTNDPYVAMQRYDEASPGRMQTVAIFDDNGEGEPLDPHGVEEILDREWDLRVGGGPKDVG